MDKLYSWTAKRAGGRITIDHSCGKIAGIDSITVDYIKDEGKEPYRGVVATHHDGRKFALLGY